MAKRYTEHDLKKLAIEFYMTNMRPPKLKELAHWRTILRRWENSGAWLGFLHDAGIPTYEEWEYAQRIKALKKVLAEHGEIPQKEYNKLVELKKYLHLPDILTLNRMFNTCELGVGGKVWEKVENINDEAFNLL